MADRDQGELGRQFLGSLLSGEEPEREAAALALMDLGLVVVPDLEQAFAQANADSRWWICRTLAGISDEAATAVLLRAVDDPDPDVRVCAMLGLAERGATEATAVILPHLDDPNPYVIAQAGDALGRLGQRAVPELVTRLRSGPASARVQAARALAVLQVQEAIPALIAALDDESPAVQVYAQEALDRMGVGVVFYRA